MLYTLTHDPDTIRRDSDGACIPGDANNTDRQAYQAWLAAGHTPTPAPAPPPVIPSTTGARLRGALTDAQTAAVDKYLAAATPATRDYWVSGYRGAIPKDSPKLARIAAGAGLDLEAWFARVK